MAKENIWKKIRNIDFKNQKILIITIISILVVVTLLATTTYAMFFSTASSAEKELYQTGDLVVKLKDSSSTAINLNPAKPVSDAYGSTLDPYTFSIENTGDYTATYKVFLTEEVITNQGGLTNQQVKSNIKYQLNDGKPMILTTAINNVIVTGSVNPGETKTYDLRMWITEEANVSMENATYSATIAVSGKATIGYTQEPNAPALAEGMIPVIYDETNDVWEVADTNTEWYNYSKQKWANAVTTSEESYRTASSGTEIPMSAINSMWVWIPRFKYNIPSDIGSSSAVTSPPQIDVVFESGTEATGVDETTYRSGLTAGSANTNYYTHPAFRNIDNINYDSSTTSRGAWDEEITGFWVGKFETGNTAATPMIKPDIQALVSQNVSTQFLTSLKFAGGTMNSTTGKVKFSGNSTYGLTSVTDTHMMKNTEWGAVAILSQSQYGKMGNTNYTGVNKEVYKNNSSGIYTGRSSGIPTATETTYGTYSYNDMTCGTDSSECTGDKIAYSGTGASTTGTIYGVYDMSGGGYEYTMGNWSETASSSGFATFPSSKYYDLYNGVSSNATTKEKAILGDATWETMKWYSDTSLFPYESQWWFRRGAKNSDNSSGIFNSMYLYGNPSTITSFRTVLIP